MFLSILVSGIPLDILSQIFEQVEDYKMFRLFCLAISFAVTVDTAYIQPHIKEHVPPEYENTLEKLTKDDLDVEEGQSNVIKNFQPNNNQKTEGECGHEWWY